MTRPELIARFYALHQRILIYKPEIEEYDKLKKELLAIADDNATSTETFVAATKDIEIQISARSKQSRIVSLFKIYQRVGATKFLHYCSLTLQAARELLPSCDEEGIIVTEQVGPRRVVAVINKKAAA